nr:MAG TPA: hypothetical protein [Bacteriophage sp.]
MLLCHNYYTFKGQIFRVMKTYYLIFYFFVDILLLSRKKQL